MTKTEMMRRARIVRAHLARFNNLQLPYMREHVRREWGTNPDYNAMNRLLSAKRELDALITELRSQGYGA